MSEKPRPDPDALLRQIAQEERQGEQKAGKLKIFLGYAAGVGKTYTMLEEARLLKKKGVDVVAALVETHGRAETEALLQGIEVIPRRRAEYGGVALEEMDLDAVLARHPAVALVDELAHTNCPGSRHAKRYQDVEELLQAGITVYTTLNIQHVESLNDTVHQVTNVRMQETVPDRLLTTAEAVELVDLPPEKLLERFAEGKVYVPAKAEQAMRQFFREGNLLALRELALRYTARHVDEDMRSYMQRHGIPGPWHAGSRLLVAVSPSPSSERLIRDAHRMAADLDAEWFAVYVESPQTRMAEADRDSLARILRLADQLGGKVVVLTGNRVADEVVSFARSKNVTVILVGGSLRSKWQEFLRGSVVNQIIRQSGTIHVLVVGVAPPPEHKSRRIILPQKREWQPIMDSVLTVAGTTTVCWWAQDWLEFVNIAMILLLPVAVSGTFWGRRAGVIASILAVACLDFFFVPPYYTFRVADIKYLPSFCVFFAVALGTSFLADLVRTQGESGRQRAQFLSALYTFSRDLLATRGVDDLLQRATQAISEALQCEVIILLPDRDGRLRVQSQLGDSTPFDDREFGVATWAFQHGQPAGRGTATLSSAARSYVPLRASHGVVGVLGVRPDSPERTLSPDQWRLLDAFTNVIALSLSRTLPPPVRKSSEI